MLCCLTHNETSNRPIGLIGHGGNDVRCKVTESDQIVAATAIDMAAIVRARRAISFCSSLR